MPTLLDDYIRMLALEVLGRPLELTTPAQREELSELALDELSEIFCGDAA